MAKIRLDNALLERGLVSSRSQAENWIKLGKVSVNGKKITKAGYFVDEKSLIELEAENQYVSRAGLKLESVAKTLKLDFRGKIVLDVGSSTGGFTDYSLRNGAQKVYAVDVGTDQLHPSLRGDKRIELHEKTDIRDAFLVERMDRATGLATKIKDVPDIVVIDVSFISLREILPHIYENLADKNTQIVAMVKPQFEAGRGETNKGVIKNEAIRRRILRDFETWARQYFTVIDKRDSEVTGAKGNRERFYLLKAISKR